MEDGKTKYEQTDHSPGAYTTRENLHDDLARLGVVPVKGDRLEVAAFLEERECLVRLGVCHG